MSERDAAFYDLVKYNPEAALNEALFDVVHRQNQIIRVLSDEAQKLGPAQANAWELGFNYARDQYITQKQDPNHPINRINPYKGEQA